MKITKEELLIRLSKLMFYVDPRNSVAGDFDFLHKLKVEFEEVEAIYNSLWKDELEIEGYERSQWVKFDPEEVDTFPPHGHYLCVSSNGGEVDVAYRGDKCTDEIFASLPHSMEYWRTLPNPPVEAGVQ